MLIQRPVNQTAP